MKRSDIRALFVCCAALAGVTGPAGGALAQPLGCFKDEGDPTGTRGRDLNGFARSLPKNSTSACVSECKSRGFAYAGTQYSSWCFCGNSYGRFGKATNCDMRCTDGAETCGGFWANSVFGTAGPIATHVPTPDAKPGWLDRLDREFRENPHRYYGNVLTIGGSIILAGGLLASWPAAAWLGAGFVVSGLGAFNAQRPARPSIVDRQVESARERISQAEHRWQNSGGITKAEREELGIVYDSMRGMTPEQRAQVYRSVGIEFQSRAEAFRQMRESGAW